MAIKEIPTNFRVYYASMRSATTQKKESAIEAREELIADITELSHNIKSKVEHYEKEFKVKLNDYEEFVENKYITGKFLRLAKGMFLNRSNNYELVSDLFDLHKLASKQKELHNLEHDIELYDKLLNLSLKEYNHILKVYFTEVHKQMVLNGYGYHLGGNIGWICFNRCKLVKHKPRIDFIATRRREAELKAQGKKIYNKEEADWCKAHGIDYVAEDKRVFQNLEYVYELPLINSTVTSGPRLEFRVSNYVGRNLSHYTYDKLLELANYDTTKICELDIDIRKKLTLCEKVDKILYTKFIRNENQEPIINPKVNRKNRQRL